VYSSVTCHSVLAEETSRRRSGEPHWLVDYLHCRRHGTTALRHAAPRQDIELCRGSERVNVTSTPHSSSFSSLDIQRSTSKLLLSPLLERMFFHPFFFVDLLFVDLTDVVIEDVSFSGGGMGSPILRTIGRTLTLTLFTDSPPRRSVFRRSSPLSHPPSSHSRMHQLSAQDIHCRAMRLRSPWRIRSADGQ
jgi:hypothetical protein